jgi:hypothetical protein
MTLFRKQGRGRYVTLIQGTVDLLVMIECDSPAGFAVEVNLENNGEPLGTPMCLAAVDDRLLAVGLEDGGIALFSLRDPTLIDVVHPTKQPVFALVATSSASNPPRIAVSSVSSPIRLYDVVDDRLVSTREVPYPAG